MANCPEVGILYSAIWRAGGVVTPGMFLLPEEDLRHQIADSEATVVCTTPEFEDKVRSAVAGLAHVRAVITTGPGGDGLLSLAELETGSAGPIVARADDDLAALLYTGGTTGRAKGVMLTHANLHYTAAAAHASAYVPGITRGLGTLPLSRLRHPGHDLGDAPPRAGVRGPAALFDPVAFPALVAEHGLQISAVVPSMLQILLGQPLEEHDLSSLRYVTSGGAPLAPDVTAESCRRVPSVSIGQGYELTETGALISSNPVGRERPGSVGLPVPGCEVQVVNDEGETLAAGEAGEITACSPGVMQGYWHAPEATAEAIQNGWLHTGDVGYQDADGYLFIVDRKKDLIIRGGFNVYPRDVEDALVEHAAVSVAGVVGQPQIATARRSSRSSPDRRLRADLRRAGRLGPGTDRRLQVPACGPCDRRGAPHPGRQDRSQGAARSPRQLSVRHGRFSDPGCIGTLDVPESIVRTQRAAPGWVNGR